MTMIDFTRGFELALERAGHSFPRLSRIRAKADPRHRVQIAAPGVIAPSFYLVDVTLADDEVRLIEANGSNGALSSTIAEGDSLRAAHMAFTFETKVKPVGQVVALLCHQAGFHHLAEFFVRAELFAAELSRGRAVALRNVGEEFGNEEVAVICGSTADMSATLRKHGDELLYMGRPVAFASNANLLPELARRGVIGGIGGAYDIDDGVFHEGAGTPLVHDKALQQQIAQGTGIRPLASQLAHDREGWIEAVRWFQSRGMPCVAKMHAGSGGAGIELVTPELNAGQCMAVLDRLFASARRTYGSNIEETAFPIALFEFAKADPVYVNRAPHLWDLRVMTLVYPGRVDCHACVGRLCPAPVDGSWSRETWVSNLSGRDGNQADRWLRSPGDLGLREADLRRILESCAQWAAAAGRFGMIGAGTARRGMADAGSKNGRTARKLI